MIQGVERPFILMNDEELNIEIVGCLIDLDNNGDAIVRKMNPPERYLFELLKMERVLRN